eukprot:m.8526 g.8526  ORF g.8526 m.8526 type:complete len:95 (+) comp6535_c0_seq1:1198-1482(+)
MWHIVATVFCSFSLSVCGRLFGSEHAVGAAAESLVANAGLQLRGCGDVEKKYKRMRGTDNTIPTKISKYHILDAFKLRYKLEGIESIHAPHAPS